MSDPAPYYTRHVFCCTNERAEGHPRGCCKARNAEAMRNHLKVRTKELGIPGVRINAAGCLDRCELGPTMVIYPEGVWYRYENEQDVEEILRIHIAGNGCVERLMLQPEDGPK